MFCCRCCLTIRCWTLCCCSGCCCCWTLFSGALLTPGVRAGLDEVPQLVLVPDDEVYLLLPPPQHGRDQGEGCWWTLGPSFILARLRAAGCEGWILGPSCLMTAAGCGGWTLYTASWPRQQAASRHSTVMLTIVPLQHRSESNCKQCSCCDF